MKRKPIKVDWDELESAFNNNNEELQYYLDLVTGQIVLEGEGEEDVDDDDGQFERGATISVARGEGTRLPIEPPGDERKLVWLDDFLEKEEIEPEIVERFHVAMEQPDVVAIRELMREHDEVRDSWYLYRSERLRERIDDWLATHEVAIVEPPPWRG